MLIKMFITHDLMEPWQTDLINWPKLTKEQRSIITKKIQVIVSENETKPYIYSNIIMRPATDSESANNFDSLRKYIGPIVNGRYVPDLTKDTGIMFICQDDIPCAALIYDKGHVDEDRECTSVVFVTLTHEFHKMMFTKLLND